MAKACLAASALALLSSGCGIAELDLTGKTCPCPEPYVCDSASNTCRKAGVQDAAAACPAVEPAPPSTIASGKRHVCSIKTDGSLWCFGSNVDGQLGTGSTTPSTLPQRVGSDTNWRDVAALSDHTCGAKNETSTQLFCWGLNSDGQIGVGNVDPQWSPAIVDFNRAWLSSAAGASISCGITLGSELFCWGSEGGGASGTGQASGTQTSPYPVNSTLTFAQVSAGSGNGCAVATDGGLYCWGQNDCFKTGHDANMLTPTRVGSGCYRQAATSHRHTCVIDSDSHLFCFGSNTEGALGTGIQGQGATDTFGCTDAYLEPQAVMPEMRWLSVAVGFLSSCAISEAHELWCWGFNDNLQVSSTPGTALLPVKVNGDTDWAEAAPGMFHTCAKKLNGDVYCMGGDSDLGLASAPLTQISF